MGNGDECLLWALKKLDFSARQFPITPGDILFPHGPIFKETRETDECRNDRPQASQTTVCLKCRYWYYLWPPPVALVRPVAKKASIISANSPWLTTKLWNMGVSSFASDLTLAIAWLELNETWEKALHLKSCRLSHPQLLVSLIAGLCKICQLIEERLLSILNV